MEYNVNMAISTSLQLGKAAEHLVCFDLIRQGYNAFLADQGCGFDVLVEKNYKIYRIQVKARSSAINVGKSKNVYRFLTRRGLMSRGKKGRVTQKNEVDFFAFVAVDLKKIAYLPVKQFSNKDGTVFQCIELKTKDSYGDRNVNSRVFESYSKLNI